MKFAAIDIGSNAMRLLFCNVFERDTEVIYKKEELIRVPLRLGEDAFTNKIISTAKQEKFLKSMQAFKLLIDVNEPIAYKACATSAMREAANSEALIKQAYDLYQLEIEIIDGTQEAKYIYENQIADSLEKEYAYLYIDVGGGSTQITLFKDAKIVLSRSFNIGTIRMLNKQVTPDNIKEFKNWIQETTNINMPLIGIGSGGNMNKIQRMLKKTNKPVSYNKIQELYTELSEMSYKDRIEVLGLKPDRADVIIPAAKIFLIAMGAAGIQHLIVPEVGLSDGIIHHLYNEYKASTMSTNYVGTK